MSGPLDSAKIPSAAVVGGTYNASAPAPVDGQSLSLQQDAQGNLLVNVAVGGGGGSSTVKIEDTSGNALNSNGSGALNVAVVSGGGSNPSVGTVGSTTPTSATLVGGTNGTDLEPLNVDGSGNLKTVIEAGTAGTPAGSVVSVQGVSLGTAIPVSGTVTADIVGHSGAILDGTAGSPSAGVLTVQGAPGGTAIPVSGTVTAPNASVGSTGVAAPTSATEIGIISGGGNLTGVSPTTPLPISATDTANASGNPIFTETVAGSTTAVTQATGSNLHTVLDSGTLTSITNALPAGSNVIGHVVTDSGSTTAVTQGTASNLHALVTTNADGSASGGTAATTSLLSGGVYNSAAPVLTNGQQASVQLDSSGNLNVNIKAGSSGNAAASATGSAVPAFASYTGVNIGGNLVGVTGLALGGTTKAAEVAIVDGSGNQITSFSGGTQYTDGTSESVGGFTVTAAGLYNGTAVVGLRGDASNNLKVNLQTALPAGSNLIGQTEITDGTNGPAAVKPAIGTNTVPPTFSTAGATGANPALVTTISPNSGLPAIIQKTAGTGSGSQASLSTSNFTNPVVAGNSIVVVVGVGTNALGTIADTIGNSYVLAGRTVNGATLQTLVFYATNIKGGVNAVTYTAGATVSIALTAYEVSGIIGAGGGITTVDQQGSLEGTQGAASNTNSASSGSGLVTLYPNEIAFGGVSVATGTVTISGNGGSPWNQDENLAIGGTPSGLVQLFTFSESLGVQGVPVSLSIVLSAGNPNVTQIAVFRPAVQQIGGSATALGYYSGAANSALSNVTSLSLNPLAQDAKGQLYADLNFVLGAIHSKTNPVFTNITDGINSLSAAISAWGVAPTGTEVMGVNANLFIGGVIASAAASGIQKVGIVGSGAGVFDAVLGAAIPANAIQVGGSDGTDLRALLTSNTGQLHILADSGSTTAVSGIVEVAPTGSANTKTNPFFNEITDGTNNMGAMVNFGSTPGAVTALNVNASLAAGTVMLTSNSISFVAGKALDVNILGADGTAFGTAGVLDDNIKNIAGNAVSTAASGTMLVGLADGSGNKISSNQTTQSHSLDVNIVSVLGATMSNTNPLFSSITDGTTKVGVVVASTSLKTDLTSIAGTGTATAAGGVQKVGIVGGTGTSLETTAGVLDYNLKNIGNATVSTAASGIQKVGIVGNNGATVDAAVNSGTAPTNAIWTAHSPTTQSQGSLLPKPINTTAQQVIKASPGNLYGAFLLNLADTTATTTLTVQYVHFFNTTTTTGLSTTSWLFALPIPGSLQNVVGTGAGSPLSIPPGAHALANFSSGIVIVISATSTSGTTAGGTAPVGVLFIQ